jgi:hypothetical protein
MTLHWWSKMPNFGVTGVLRSEDWIWEPIQESSDKQKETSGLYKHLPERAIRLTTLTRSAD